MGCVPVETSRGLQESWRGSRLERVLKEDADLIGVR